MPLTEEQAFKVGFLLKCAESGLSIEETKLRVKLAIATLRQKQEKRAFGGVLWPASASIAGTGAYLGGKALDLGRAVIPPAMSAAGTAAIALPILGGGLAGYAAAKLPRGDKDTVEDAKQDEIIGEYDRLADEARRRARLKQLQETTGRRVIALTPEDNAA